MDSVKCKIFGHNYTKWLIDGDGVHLPRCVFLRVKICDICNIYKL